ncbi:hypothetical protein RchiOBHm_Chr5g0010681 [Rosa chinensis]|uniref:Uncharacterized protein n=1 Tax=Rosa chinensis TaxID=74649 RepID=A0A2P6Q4N2_ROSCH|nr:hypothetical protein RchiOBHm_Chr5g0010681 [Rosa chinensis]
MLRYLEQTTNVFGSWYVLEKLKDGYIEGFIKTGCRWSLERSTRRNIPATNRRGLPTRPRQRRERLNRTTWKFITRNK